MARSNGNGSAPHKAPGMVTWSFSLPPELANEVDNARDTLFIGNRSLLISEALERLLEHLRSTRNDGKPFRTPARIPSARRNRR